MINGYYIDLIDLSGLLDNQQKINVSHDDGTTDYTGTLQGCPLSLGRIPIIQLEAAGDTLIITLTKE